MATFNEEQKRIAVLLMHEPKTVEDLHKQLGIPYDRLNDHLKEMLRLEVIDKTGFPVKYRLRENISNAVSKRKQIAQSDKFKLRLRVMIEAQAIEQSLLEKELRRIEEALRKEKNFTIYDCVLAKMIKEGEHYKSFLDVNLSVKDLASISRLLFFYGPSSIEVIKPAKFDITAHDLQEALMNLADMIQAYNQYIIKMMNKKELDEFNRKLFSQR